MAVGEGLSVSMFGIFNDAKVTQTFQLEKWGALQQVRINRNTHRWLQPHTTCPSLSQETGIGRRLCCKQNSRDTFNSFVLSGILQSDWLLCDGILRDFQIYRSRGIRDLVISFNIISYDLLVAAFTAEIENFALSSSSQKFSSYLFNQAFYLQVSKISM